MNLCRRCGQDFGSVSAFDAHRVGNHAYLWAPEQEDGRRCLDTSELAGRGWGQDKRGAWRQPIAPDAVLRLRHLRRRAAA